MLSKNVAELHYKKFHTRILQHINPLILNLSSGSLPGDPTPPRLTRQWLRDIFATQLLILAQNV